MSGEAKTAQKLKASETAILLIEFQNEFAAEKGKLNGAVKDVMKENNQLEKVRGLIKKARENKVQIIHSHISFDKEHSNNRNPTYGILNGCKEGGLFQEGTWNVQPTEGFEIQKGDLKVVHKTGLDAFANTNLDTLLRTHNIKNVAICGFLTDCCVESTMRTAYEKCFNVYTLLDGSATGSADRQKMCKERFGMFSHPVNVADFEKLI